jgi:hypothetical protein
MRLWCAGLALWAVAAGCTVEPGDDAADGATSTGAGAGPPSSAKPVCASPGGPMGGIPAARADSAAALSADARSMVMFGGDVAIVVCGDVPKRDHVGDTWLLDTACGGWTQLMTPGPSPRARHAMATDAARNRALLFGGRYRDKGQTGNYTLYNDVWAFDFAAKTWSQLPTGGTPPSPRANTAMAIDGDTLWMFGGTTSPSALAFTPSNDLYALDLKTNQWRAVTAQGAPTPRLFHAMTIDPATHRAYVGWGGDENAFVGPFFKDIAVLDLATLAWSPLAVAPAAGATEGRIKLGMAVRSASAGGPARLYAFAGHDDGALGNRNDLLATDLGGAAAWKAEIKGDTYNKPPAGQCNFAADFVINDPQSMERRSSFAFASLPNGEAFVVFGGDSDCGRLSDAWWYDTRAARWTAIAESLPGLSCLRTGNPSCKSLCG